ncbi:acetamidase/formamidase family protein [Natranaeroarchaeum aerophilus]|uniref:Acetamidase/formamidase family protein n=1 Tax=Natranaeroarchaeum aerophilus TaxID=2917711 RepID=A0AAE3FRN4_9EURY|nr:acetamidase/formamidase family protein [Natranaeroarchaeum aerophilus]MCL9814089.1 acetamidase/formamidase family protein [Natranaeroarchaeum aerophilus]
MDEDDRTTDHRITPEEDGVHHSWNNEISPVCTIEPGEVVEFSCRDATNGQIDADSTVADLAGLDIEQVHALTGPVAIQGAAPGDVLTIEILDISHQGWGYTLVLPGEMEHGLLAEEFPEPMLHIWNLDDGVARFVDGIEVPIDPFPGILGVAPAESGSFETFPPLPTGGNIDIKHLTPGSTAYLPVDVEDALFSIGDCHAAQGDGEVCGTGIEAPMSVTCRFDVETGRSTDAPQFETDGPFTPSGRDERMFGTTGVGDDLYTASADAVRAMVEHLHEERGLAREQAYVLCSAAVDLKINQIVNAPNWTVSAYLPERVFQTE